MSRIVLFHPLAQQLIKCHGENHLSLLGWDFTAIKGETTDLLEMVEPTVSLWLAKQLRKQKMQHKDSFSHFQAVFEGCTEMLSSLEYSLAMLPK